MSSVDTGTMRFQLISKNVLSPDEAELFELTQLAGVVMDQNVFKIILDLLKMNCSTTAIVQMLKSMCGHRRKKTTKAADSHSSQEDSQSHRHRQKPDSHRQHSTITQRPEAI